MRPSIRLLAASASLFSVLVAPACKDRVFDNPLDPNPSQAAYEVVATLSTPGISPLDLTFSGEALWIADGASRIVAISEKTGSVIRTLDTPEAVGGIAYDGADLWVASRGGREIRRLSVVTGLVIHVLTLVRGSLGPIDAVGGKLYLADRLANAVLVVDETTATVEQTIPSPGFSLDGLFWDGSTLWILDSSLGKIFRVSARGAVLATYSSPTRSAAGMCRAGGRVWLGDRAGGAIQLRFP